MFISKFVSKIRFKHREKKKVYEWNQKNRIGTCVEFIDGDKEDRYGLRIVKGKTINKAFLDGFSARVDIRDDNKDGLYDRDYTCSLRVLRIVK